MSNANQLYPNEIVLRGDIIIKKREILEFFQKKGGGIKTPQKCLKFKFGHLKTHV